MKKQFNDDYKLWLNTVTDEDLIDDLNKIRDDEDEITSRFGGELSFGTAGLRAMMGAGPNRMNIYTVRRAASGLANYLNQAASDAPVAIAYDNRTNSEKFAKAAAVQLAFKGVKVNIFTEITPVPVLSFAVRELKCGAGIMITASHNTAEYNGFKCYNKDGYQMTDGEAEAVTAEIDKLEMMREPQGTFEEYLQQGIISYIDESLFESYYEAVYAQALLPESVPAAGLRVLYTPLNGTGFVHVVEVLKKLGIENLDIVESQKIPDQYFTTCPQPNPELEQAYEQAYSIAEQTKPDIIIATDPDSDRLGVAVRSGQGGYKLLSGNEVGCLLADYLLSGRQKKGTLPKEPVIAKSFVASPMAIEIAKTYGCTVVNLPVGFKYIGEYVTTLEAQGESDRFILGFEESNGYLAGTYARDKDAVMTAMLVCEMAALNKLNRLSLLDAMEGLYKKYGAYHSEVQSIEVSDMGVIAAFMEAMRAKPPKAISGMPVIDAADYLISERIDMATGERSLIEMPASNALEYSLDTATLAVRPSGTEPKLKLYYTARAQGMDEATVITDGIKRYMEKVMVESGVI